MTKEWCYTWAHDLDQYDLVSFIDANKQQKENYPTISSINDTIDMDGIGNQGRVPVFKTRKRIRKKVG